MKKVISIFFYFLFIFASNAQVKVKVCNTTDFTPSNLITNEFLGDGVEVLNVKYIGEEYSTGKFSNIGDVIGIDRGIIMTTGKASMASIPNSPEKHTSYSSDLGSDPDLSKAAETDAPLYDICTFEITFKPFSDFLSFDYVFASNEYPEFSCDSFNDVFGFFISGPNPDGGLYDYENIALIPNTDSAVSIHNIHPEFDDPSGTKPYCPPDHEIYYTPLAQSARQKMFYDGYTDIFTAEAKVVPCQEYKIKISIADVADKTHDSAVFLKAKSFSTNVLKTQLITMSHDSTIAEGCTDASIRFYFNDPVAADYDLALRILTTNIFGNIASYDTDYKSNINTVTSIKKGQTAVALNFTPVEDNIIEDEEYILVEYQKDLCNKDTIILKIVDNELANIILDDSVQVCNGDTVNVNAELSNEGSSSKDKYFTNPSDYIIPKELNGSISSPIEVTGIYPGDIQLWKLKEICIDTLVSTVLSDLDIYLISPMPDKIKLELSTDNGYKPGDLADIDSMINTCFTPTATVPINNGNSIQGDFNPLNPKYTGNFKPEGYFDDLAGKQANGTWQLQITNDQAGFTSLLKSWHISFKSNYTIDYNWTPKHNISCDNCLSPDIFPKNNTLYKISLTDSYGCSTTDSIKAIVEDKKTIPYIDCDSISTDLIRIKWGINTPGEIYEIRIDNGPWEELNINEYTKSGLTFSQTVEFEVRIKSADCIYPSTFHKCTTYNCPAPDITTVSITDNKCFGDSNGSIQISASGTVAPYTFVFHGTGNTTGYFENLPTGTDTIFVTDGDGCTVPYVFTINSPPQIGADYTIEEIKCHNEKNGAITANGFGGKGILKYKWANPSTGNVYLTKKINNLEYGVYRITITDDNACVYSDSVILVNPDAIKIESSIDNISCKGDYSGKILLDVSGGTPPYTYNWNTPIGNSSIKDLSNIPAGQYFVTVTDINNCHAIKSFSITEPEDGLDVQYSSKDSLCFGEKDGSIVLSLPPNNDYQIIWSNGDTGEAAYNLPAGHYEITITDNNIGCEKIIKQDIIELDSLTMSLGQSDASCHDYEDGTAWVEKIYYGSRETGMNGFRYLWSTNPAQHNQYAYDLKGGRKYSVQITNNFGCSAKESITIGNPPPIQIKEIEKRDVSCNGLSDGYIEVANAGGNNNYTYKWSSNTGTVDKPYIENLKPGIYKLTVTDEKGCKEEALFYIKEPDPISIDFDNKPVSCFRGSDGGSTPIIKGGRSPYIVRWEGIESEKILNNVKAGKYFIQITDINGCEKTDSTIIEEPKDSVYSFVETYDTKCHDGFDGKISFTTSGGTPPYSNKVIGDKYYSGTELIGLKGGIYTAVTRDINGCTDTIKDIVINEPEPLIVDLGNDTIVDYKTKIHIFPTITNAIPPISYTWEIPEGINYRCIDCPDPELEVLYNILVKLRIKDSLNCIGSGVKNISVRKSNNIFVPDAFIPGSNQLPNKYLFVYGKEGTRVISFKVYNSLGGKVYQRDNFLVNDESMGWDGTFNRQELNSGSFIWTLKIKNIDGTIQNFNGIVTLIR